MNKTMLLVLSTSLAVTTLLSVNVSEVDAAKKDPKSIFLKGAHYVIQKIDNKYYNVPASTSSNDYSVTMTPGSLSFNDGKNKGLASVEFNALSTKHSVITYAKTSRLGAITLKKMNISLSKGNKDIDNKRVESSQWFSYRPSSTGMHKVRFVTTDSNIKWTPYVVYRWDTGGLPIGGTRSIMQSSEDDMISTYENLSIVDKNPQEQLEESMISTDAGNFFIPSENHYEETTIKDSLSFKELNLQFYDENLETVVYQMKNYTTGDTVIMKDKVTKVEFNEETSSSELYFESNKEPLEFEGDLTSEELTGTDLSLEFEVVELEKDYQLTVLDYNKEFMDTEKIPNIDNFIIK